MWLERLQNIPLFLEKWLQHQRRDAYWSTDRYAGTTHAPVRRRKDKKTGSEGSIMTNGINDKLILAARLLLAALFLIFG